MSENKRLQIIHLGNPYDFVIKDHQTNRTYGTLQGDDKSLKECLDNIVEENEQLKKANNSLQSTIAHFDGVKSEYSKKLEKENKQLKIQINNISAQRDEFHHGAKENANQIGRLEKENEQLKQQLTEIKEICNKHKIPATLTAYIPNEDNCKHYHACHKNHMVNAQSWGEMKIAKEILKLIDGDGV